MNTKAASVAVVIDPPQMELEKMPERSQGQSDSSSLMRMIDSAMQRPDFDVDKLVKLIEVKERWEANEARLAFTDAMARFKEAAPKIYKDKHVSFETSKGSTEYDHATIGNVVEQIVGCLAAHGISHGWKTRQVDGGQVAVTCILTHRRGHSESNSLQSAPDQSGGKNSIQAMASTVSYLERYTLLAITGLATSDMDDDGRAGGQAQGKTPAASKPTREFSQEEIEALRARIKATTTIDELGEVWKALSTDERSVMNAAKNAQKERLTDPPSTQAQGAAA